MKLSDIKPYPKNAKKNGEKILWEDHEQNQ